MKETRIVTLKGNSNKFAKTSTDGAKSIAVALDSEDLKKIEKLFKSRTGLIYDVRMINHDEIVHKRDHHPESPLRIYKIFKALEDSNCLSRMTRMNFRPAQDHELELFHDREYVNFMTLMKSKPQKDLLDLSESEDSVYFNALTDYCARLSCGGVIELLRNVVVNKIDNGIAVVRPPGHHAERDRAVAVMKMRETYNVNKVLVLDWDVHHGNGIQQAFYDEPDVLYISLHRYMDGFYPGTGPIGEVGEGLGIGRNVNITFTQTGMGDHDYIYAFHNLIMPIALEFQPELVVVAAGFDAAMDDPLGEFKLTPNGYANMTHLLMSLANGKLAICLEGGYNLNAIANSALAVTRTLLGVHPVPLGPLTPSPTGLKNIDDVKRMQEPYWDCLKE